MISLDTLELSFQQPENAPNGGDSADGGAENAAIRGQRGEGDNKEDSMLGEAQWDMLDKILADKVRHWTTVRRQTVVDINSFGSESGAITGELFSGFSW